MRRCEASIVQGGRSSEQDGHRRNAAGHGKIATFQSDNAAGSDCCVHATAETVVLHHGDVSI